MGSAVSVRMALPSRHGSSDHPYGTRRATPVARYGGVPQAVPPTGHGAAGTSFWSRAQPDPSNATFHTVAPPGLTGSPEDRR